MTENSDYPKHDRHEAEHKSSPLSTRFNRDIHEKIVDWADEEDISRAEALRRLSRAGVKVKIADEPTEREQKLREENERLEEKIETLEYRIEILKDDLESEREGSLPQDIRKGSAYVFATCVAVLILLDFWGPNASVFPDILLQIFTAVLIISMGGFLLSMVYSGVLFARRELGDINEE